MRACDVIVTVLGGVAHVEVFTPSVIVEVRDYNVEGFDEDHELWTDEHGNRCVRYSVEFEEAEP